MNSPFARDTTANIMSSEAFPRWWRISSCHRYQVLVQAAMERGTVAATALGGHSLK